MNVSDLMTREVVSIAPECSVEEAVRLMLDKHLSGLPVIDSQGKLAGIVTEGDFLRRGEVGTLRHRPRWLEFILGQGRLADEYTHTHGRRIAEIMTWPVVAVADDAPLASAVDLMERHRIKRLPVVCQERVVGIVSRADLMRALASLTRHGSQIAATDQAIRRQLVHEIESQSWGPGGTIHVVVHDGVVDISGTVFDLRQRDALRVAAENIAGVRKVRDELIWIEPMSGAALSLPDELGRADAR
jgi:CBS domain-containing protein